MGAGAVKELVPDVETRNSPVEMSCESCSIHFTLMKRKKVCFDCSKNHCSNCMTKSSGTKSSMRRCKKCQLLTSGNFSRSDLMTLPTKDLRSFLVRRKIPMNNCTEKVDLVDILLSTSNNSHYKKEQAEKQRHLIELKERKRRQELDSGRWGNAGQSQNEFIEPTATTTPDIDEDTQSSSADPSISHTQSPTDFIEASSSTVDTPAVADGEIDGAELESTPPVDEQPSPEDETVMEDIPVVSLKVTRLTDLKDVSAVDELTVRQLKEILVTNYVAYKGCCERWELVERVTRLYHDYQKNLGRAVELENEVNAGSADAELCKICMDAVIDCVLLDCGHMVSCTQCGKQMAECPMCRQYVIRVVHVFKA